jgi:hypothetical protein
LAAKPGRKKSEGSNLATIELDGKQRSRVEYEARRWGSACRVCGTPNLISRDTAIGHADGTVRVYLDCAMFEGHDAEASLEFDPRAARHLLRID